MTDRQTTGAALSREYLEMKYEKTPELQQEFASAAEYVAYKKAEAAGRVRIIANRIVAEPRPGK